MKVESFQDLINLSFEIHNLRPDEEQLVCPQSETLDKNHKLVNILYKQLNEVQQKCFNEIHNDLNNRPYSITLLDSRPGTGKSHLMATFGLSCNLNMLFVVYKQELVDYMNQMPYWDCYTAAKFKIKLFQLNSYKNFFSKFDSTSPSVHDVIARIFVLTKMVDLNFIADYDVFIIDEYTVLNPEMVLAFCFMAIVYNKHIIFCGDKCQQNSIDKSSQSAGVSNYYFINVLATRLISLVNSVRCKDGDYNQKLDIFRELIESSGSGSTPMNFASGFKLYELFRNKFYNSSVFESGCYFASHHKTLTIYTKKFREHLIRSERKFGVAQIIREDGSVVPEHDEKFYYDLLLIPGMVYIYNKKRDPNIPYGQYKLKSYSTDNIVIQNQSMKTYVVSRVRLCAENILDTFYDRLCSKYKGPFKQFPLSPLYTSTYHNAQGLTLNCNVDLNLSRTTCESVYVGLSRIRSEHQLNRLEHEQFLRSFEYSFNQNDDYYYLINNPNQMDFVETMSLENKHNKNKNYKIKKINAVVNDIKSKPLIVQAADFISSDIVGCVGKFKNFILPDKGDNLKASLGYLLV